MSRPIAVLTAVLLVACGDPPEDTGASASAGGSTSASSPSSPTGVEPTTGGDEVTSAGTGTLSGDGTGTTAVASETGPLATGSSETGVGPTSDPSSDPSSSSDPSTTTTSTSEPGTTTTGDPSGDPSSDTGDDTTTGVGACECPDLEVALDDGIFVLSDDSEVWKYFPESNTFEMLGTIACPGLFSTFSMAVDRQGFAWVQYVGGELRKVNLTDLGMCDDPGYNPGQLGVTNFGMAFVSNSAVDVCDRIYGNTWNGIPPFSEGPGVGDFITIDPDTLILSKLGKTNFNGAEGSGSGDGRAFIFGGAFPAKLVEVDKTDASVIDTLPLNGLEINNGAFAFAFFAGDFYFFTDSNNNNISEVTHLDYDDSDMNGKQDLVQVEDAAPLVIVGAGVSTCAPFLPQ
ncbi:MAG: hypothetical protein JNL82_03340 [Myxococcales bacterium]|nr:hypothetical protein [Myxococcales bacterium]